MIRKIKCKTCGKELELKQGTSSVFKDRNVFIYTCECGQKYREIPKKIISITKEMILQE